MCKTKMAVNASDPNSARSRPTQSQPTRPTQSPRTPPIQSSRARPTFPSSISASSDPSTSNTGSATYTTTSTSSLSSRTSLSSLRDSLSQNPHIYDISEIRSATNNFLSKRHSSSSTACWRCNLRNSDTIVFQRKFRRKIEMSQLKERLSVICRSNHSSVIKLLGACISGDHIYLVYEFIPGANLSNCLRNPRNPNFTVLSSWISRMQVATDLAYGLDYIHNKTGLTVSGLVHNHIKSSSIIVTEPSFNAKICHFGAAQLCGEADENELLIKMSKIGEGNEDDDKIKSSPSTSSRSPKGSKGLTRSDSRMMQFEGVRGYMSPEFQATGIATQKSDVYAFGVVLLELLSGEEPFTYKYDRSSGDFIRRSVIETARAVVVDDEESGGGKEGRLRRWIDRRLKDSFPVEVAEKLTRVALECVDVDLDERPDMGRVAGKISRWYLESRIWSDNLKISDQISVSLAAR